MMTNQIVPGGFFIFRDFNISNISLIVNSIIANFEFVLNSKLGGLQLLSSKFDMEQKKLFRRLHLSISSTYKISFSVSKRGGIVQLRPTLPIRGTRRGYFFWKISNVMYFLIPCHIKEVLTAVYLHWSVTLRTTHMSLCVSSYIDNRRPTCRFVCPHISTIVDPHVALCVLIYQQSSTHMSLCVSSYIDNRRPTCRFVCPHISTIVETTKKQNNNIVTLKMLKQ